MGAPVTFTEQFQTGTAYPMPIIATVYDPLDSRDYFIGKTAGAPGTVAGLVRAYFVGSGYLRFVLFQTLISGALGSNEVVTLNIRVNDTDDYLIGTNTFDAILRVISGPVADSSGRAPYVTAADFWELKLSTPAWGTNPMTVNHSGDVFISSQPG